LKISRTSEVIGCLFKLGIPRTAAVPITRSKEQILQLKSTLGIHTVFEDACEAPY
jgi:hypothetical protein